MISEAMDTCCKSIPSRYIIPKVIPSVRGMEMDISNASRQLQKPIQETRTTRAIAS
jgi:hypothetical protein